jgi:hypothetical protein
MAKPRVPRRRRFAPFVAAVVQPVARRLARLEALLLEVRFEQDVQLKRVAALQLKIDMLADDVEETRARKSQRKTPRRG